MYPDEINDVKNLLREWCTDYIISSQGAANQRMGCKLRLVGIYNHKTGRLGIPTVTYGDAITISSGSTLTPTSEDDVNPCAVSLNLSESPMHLITSVTNAVAMNEPSDQATHRTATLTRPVVSQSSLFDLEHVCEVGLTFKVRHGAKRSCLHRLVRP